MFHRKSSRNTECLEYGVNSKYGDLSPKNSITSGLAADLSGDVGLAVAIKQILTERQLENSKF